MAALRGARHPDHRRRAVLRAVQQRRRLGVGRWSSSGSPRASAGELGEDGLETDLFSGVVSPGCLVRRAAIAGRAARSCGAVDRRSPRSPLHGRPWGLALGLAATPAATLALPAGLVDPVRVRAGLGRARGATPRYTRPGGRLPDRRRPRGYALLGPRSVLVLVAAWPPSRGRAPDVREPTARPSDAPRMSASDRTRALTRAGEGGWARRPPAAAGTASLLVRRRLRRGVLRRRRQGPARHHRRRRDIGGQTRGRCGTDAADRARRPGEPAPIPATGRRAAATVDPADGGALGRLRRVRSPPPEASSSWSPARLWSYFTGGDDLAPIVDVDDGADDGALAGLTAEYGTPARDGAVGFAGTRVKVGRPLHRPGRRPGRRRRRAADGVPRRRGAGRPAGRGAQPDIDADEVQPARGRLRQPGGLGPGHAGLRQVDR